MLIHFGSYNIWNEQNGGLDSALRVMVQAKPDLGVLQDIKVIGGVYTRGLAGYSKVMTVTPKRHLYRVSVFYFPLRGSQ